MTHKRVFLKTMLSGAFTSLSTRVAAAPLQHRIFSSATAIAPTVVKILRLADEVVREKRWAFLTTALDRTVATYGPYVIQPVTSAMSTQREITEAIAGNLINVIAIDCGHPDLNDNSIPVPIPIDRGLLGYRVSLIKRGNQDRIDTVSDIASLRRLTIGQGNSWGDVPIYRFNNIPVVTSGDYSRLFAMLSSGRFDLFPRGVVEILPEFEKNRTIYPNIVIEDHLLIKYAYAEFFYVSNAFPLLAQRIADGLAVMLEDGSFNDLFRDRFSNALSLLHLKNRVIVALKSPPLPLWVPTEQENLWLNPLAES